MVLDVDRRQVLAYRVAASGLRREVADPVALDVLDLGVQDTNVGSARLAMAARLPPGAIDPLSDPALTVLWSFRGAPHLQRSADLAHLARALWPVSDADAIARLAAERKPLKAAGIGGLEAFFTVAAALREVVTRPMAKGEVSSATTAALPAAYSNACRGCAATHVYGGLFQAASLFAGVRLVADHSPTTLVPLDERPPIPSDPVGTADVVRAYLRLHGPARLVDAAGYLGTSRAALRPSQPHDLVEVTVDGRVGLLPEDQVEALRSSTPSGLVRLLPPSDPYLQARDRALLVPDEAHRKTVWRVLANPGAVLVDGEVAGVWRARMRGKARLELTVTPLAVLSSSRRHAIEVEAATVATVRGATDVDVRYEEP